MVGFAKIDKKWRVAVKREVITSRIDPNNPNETIQDNQEVIRFPLIDAPRNYRIAGVGLFGLLLNTLNTEVEDMLKSIETGKKVLQSID